MLEEIKKKIDKAINIISKKFKNKKILPINLNLQNEDNVVDLFKKIKINKFKSIDIVINCIGINKRNIISNIDYNDWLDVINTNLNIPFLISKYSLSFLKKSKFPRFINFTSIFSTVSFEARTPYSSSKGGLLMLTKTLALEWSKYAITVNCISPGPFLTEINLPVLQNKKITMNFVKEYQWVVLEIQKK